MTQLKKICLYISILLISLSQPHVAHAQEKAITEEKDTTALFQGVAVSVDLVGPLMLALSDYGQYEAALRINLKDKYFPVFELGYGIMDYDEDPVTHISTKTKAPYFRIGCDVNIAKNIHDDYRIFVGARYGFTNYKFDLSHPGVTDPVFGGTAPYGVSSESCNRHWIEGIFGVDAKLVGPVRLGWSARYRRTLKANDGSLDNTWYTPGFGRSGKANWGGTFNITLEI